MVDIPTKIPTVQDARKQSIQRMPEADKGQYLGVWFPQAEHRPFILPLWGTRDAEMWLRWYDRLETNWMWQGARSGIGKKMSAVQWHITSEDDSFADAIPYFQAVLQEANFGRGWSHFIQQGTRDFLRSDVGWWFEIIASGNPLKSPTSAIQGIAHLDSYRCYPTGDPEFPLRYYDIYTGMHLLHASRCIQIVDTPDGDAFNPGYGECALRRAISITMRENLMTRYIQGRLDDNPPPGIVVTNLHEGERQKALERYIREQNNDRKPFWGNQFWLHAKDANDKPVIETMEFQQAPEKFDFKTYTDLDIDALALALGVDKQELWELASRSMGSGAQSEVLNQKSRGKTFGELLTQIERAVNLILPEELTFEFKFRDPSEDAEIAANAGAWGTFITSVAATMSEDEQRQLLANQVEAYRDVVTKDGEVVPLEKPEPPPMLPGQAPPFGQKPAPDGQKPSTTTGEDNTPMVPGGQANSEPAKSEAQAKKDVQSTRLDFEADFADLFTAAQQSDVNRRRFGMLARALITKYGRRAYADGLQVGGIEETSEDDTTTINQLITEQSAYVTNLGDTVYGDGTNANGADKAVLWWNKSIQPFYDAGVQASDQNGMYEWVYGATEHCKDCKRLNGQKHRMKEWVDHGWMPKSDALECKGFNCACTLKKTTGRAKGYY